MIKEEELYDKTRGGRDIVELYYPESAACFNAPTKKKFKIREEDTASVSVKFDHLKNRWIVTDFGGDGKAKSAIDVVMAKEQCCYYDAIMMMASKFGLSDRLDKSKNSPKFEHDTPPANAKDGQVLFKFRRLFTEAELRLMGPLVTQEVMESLNWHSVERIGTVKRTDEQGNVLPKADVLYKYSHDDYPIFMRECRYIDENGEEKSFFKKYEPLNVEKRYRFTYVPSGAKVPDYMHGLAELKLAFEILNTTGDGDEENGEAEGEEDGSGGSNHKQQRPEQKLNEVFICSGERDAACIRSLGYHPVWFNSETSKMDRGDYLELLKYAKQVYNIPDIDSTGIREGMKTANMFIDIKTIWLPMSLREHKDYRGKAEKDFRDWMGHNPSLQAFKNLLPLATSAKFWEITSNKKNGPGYDISSTRLMYFLWLQGFYCLKYDDCLTQTFIHIDQHIVRPVSGKDIRAHVMKWANGMSLGEKVRDLILDSPKLNDSALMNMQSITLNFRNFDEDRQLFFFMDKCVEVSEKGIKIHDKGSFPDYAHYVWEKKVIRHNLRLTDRHFEIKQLDKDNWHIDVKDISSNVFKYLINSSRVYWRKELEYNFEGRDEEAKQYYAAHRFCINGDGLSSEELQEQMNHLVNKIFTIGYLCHRYKDVTKPYAPVLMDNLISREDESNGGTGKSFFAEVCSKLQHMDMIDASKAENVKDKFLMSVVNRETDLVHVEDAFMGFRLRPFFNMISSDLYINQKNVAPFFISKSESPKFIISTNYVPADFDSSSVRRLIYVCFSDYYHTKTSYNNYLESRNIKDDVGKEIFGPKYSEEDMNHDYNFLLQCVEFYLSIKNRVKCINAPLDNILKRKALQDIGENFMEWASVKFGDTPGNPNLDNYIDRNIYLDVCRDETGLKGLTANGFKKKLISFCLQADWIDEFNPSDLCGKSHGNENRILRPDTTTGKQTEWFYIRSVKGRMKLEREIMEKKQNLFPDK